MKRISGVIFSMFLFIPFLLIAQEGPETTSESIVIQIPGGICGDCCVAKVYKIWTKGVKDIQMKLKDETITVFYDKNETSPEEILAALEKAGKKGARIMTDGKTSSSPSSTERNWVTPRRK